MHYISTRYVHIIFYFTLYFCTIIKYGIYRINDSNDRNAKRFRCQLPSFVWDNRWERHQREPSKKKNIKQISQSEMLQEFRGNTPGAYTSSGSLSGTRWRVEMGAKG